MLSPAVRANAAQFATSQLGTSSVKAIEQGYLVGYAAGYRAPKAARFPLAGDQAFKRLLGAYLAENITVYHPATGRYGLLRGLPACYAHDGQPFADVEFYCDSEAREEGGGDALEDVNKLLPVLYALTDLPGLLPTLSEELQKQIGGLGSPFRRDEAVDRVIAWIENWARRVDMLRAAGFAVGLAPHQYQRRQPGFDYASGGRPAGKEATHV